MTSLLYVHLLHFRTIKYLAINEKKNVVKNTVVFPSAKNNKVKKQYISKNLQIQNNFREKNKFKNPGKNHSFSSLTARPSLPLCVALV